MEAWNTTKMYHGSDLKLDVLKPTAYNAGHRLRNHSWSVFMWPTYELAYKWAIFVKIRNVLRVYEKRNPDIHCPRGMHTSTGFNKYDFNMFMVEDNYDFICDKCIGLKAYVYTVDCPIDLNFSIGNNNSQPEYTYDGELNITKRTEVTITKKILDTLFDKVSLEEYNRRTEEAFSKNIRGPLGLLFYPGLEPVHRWKYIYRKLNLNEIKPGDDLDAAMAKYGDPKEMERIKKAHRKFRESQQLESNFEYIIEASTPPEVHTDKLDLRGMTFIHASHRPDVPPTENSCLMMNGKKYRVRVETLIYNDKGEILAAKRDKITSFHAFYKIPGGSAEPGKTLEQQAIAESQEEVRANVKNIKFTGIWYINEFDDTDNSRLGPDTVAWLKKVGLKYDGFITVLFVAKYAGKFNGHIKKVDQVDWIKDVKFHDPKDLNLIEPHKMALQKVWFNTNSI